MVGVNRKAVLAYIDIREYAAYALVTAAVSICINRERVFFPWRNNEK